MSGQATNISAAGSGPDGIVTHGDALDSLHPLSARLAGWLARMLKEPAFQGEAVALPRAAMRGLVRTLRAPGGHGRAARAAFVIETYAGFD